MTKRIERIKRFFLPRTCRACGDQFFRSGVRFLGKDYCGPICLPTIYRRVITGHARREPA